MVRTNIFGYLWQVKLVLCHDNDLCFFYFERTYVSGLPLVREKSGKFKVREKSGNFVLGQGNLRF